MGQNIAVALHWILLPGYIKPTSETLFHASLLFFFSFLIFFFFSAVFRRDNSFHPLTYSGWSIPTNKMPKLSNETGSVHKGSVQPFWYSTHLWHDPQKSVWKLLFTAQLILVMFYHMDNWWGCNLCLALLIRRLRNGIWNMFTFILQTLILGNWWNFLCWAPAAEWSSSFSRKTNFSRFKGKLHAKFWHLFFAKTSQDWKTVF